MQKKKKKNSLQGRCVMKESNVYLRSGKSNNLSASDDEMKVLTWFRVNTHIVDVGRWLDGGKHLTLKWSTFVLDIIYLQASHPGPWWYGYWYWHSACCAYIVLVPHLDDLWVCRNHQIHLFMEMEGLYGQAIIMIFHKQGTRGTQVIQQNLQRQCHV